MPANVRTNQLVDASDVAGTDLIPISLREPADRSDKEAGYVDRTWYIPVEELAAAIAGDSAFVAALLAEFDGEIEPTWGTV